MILWLAKEVTKTFNPCLLGGFCGFWWIMISFCPGETSKFPFCDHKQTTKDDKHRWLSLCDPDLSVGPHRGYMTGHIPWSGLKYVSSQRTFCGLYVGILMSPLINSSNQNIFPYPKHIIACFCCWFKEFWTHSFTPILLFLSQAHNIILIRMISRTEL